jgi:hypothetical protein
LGELWKCELFFALWYYSSAILNKFGHGKEKIKPIKYIYYIHFEGDYPSLEISIAAITDSQQILEKQKELFVLPKLAFLLL